MEYKLQITFISRRRGMLGILRKRDIIQTLPFEFGFRLRNIGNEPIHQIDISNVIWTSANGQNITFKSDKKYHFTTINPQEELETWVERVGTYAHGLCMFKLDVKANDQNTSIQTFQIDPITKHTSLYAVNSFADFFFVRSKNEYEQSVSNFWMMFFAVMTTILAIFTFYLNRQQVYYAEIQSRSERIMQSQLERSALERCKQNPELEESGLYSTSTGKPASCKQVLDQDKNL